MTLGFVFYQIDDLNNSVAKSAISALPFCALAVTVTGMSFAYSWAPKKLASMKPRLQSFSSRWTLTCHVFIVWHLLTIWRQSFLSPATYQVIFEEILLMVFTVFVAIWSMTSKGYRSKFRLITEENALTWGLAFGYAYAGSVAMLVTFFDDIKTVMVFGHSVVVITVIFTHRLVLTRIINTDNNGNEWVLPDDTDFHFNITENGGWYGREGDSIKRARARKYCWEFESFEAGRNQDAYEDSWARFTVLVDKYLSPSK